ncbi:cytochrome P450 [Amycolatopsis sp. NPDC059027]|uniref:cytochrome P450 n=1 Tax=unclassified Amycolatopsis TaxID=2618356 RepID=UPI003672F29D
MTELTSSAAPVTSFPAKRTCPFSPPPEYSRMRDEGRVAMAALPSGQRAWVLTRHEDVRTMLTDPRFSSNRFNPGFPLMIERFQQTDEETRKNPFRVSLINMDPPEHGQARREVVGEFTVKRMRALQPRIQQIVDEHIDAMLAGPPHHGKRSADLVQALSLPVPSLVICELLGVPYEDHEFFQQRSSTLLNRQADAPERQQASDELRKFLDELVTAKEAAPGDDLLGRQIVKQRETGEVDHLGLVATAFLLLIAGHETTANMISLGTLTLLENPDQLAMIKADPGKTPDAVEELLRYFTIAEFATSRVTTEDVEIAGVVIPKGEGVIGLSNSANRDESAFENPDTLDIERGARHHVAFGFGAHQCLGQNLARMELQIVFDTLFRRIPTLKLATSVDELPFKNDSQIYGLHELPVTW